MVPIWNITEHVNIAKINNIMWPFIYLLGIVAIIYFVVLGVGFFFIFWTTLTLPKGAWEMMQKDPDLMEWYYGSQERREIMRDLHQRYGRNITGKIHRPNV